MRGSQPCDGLTCEETNSTMTRTKLRRFNLAVTVILFHTVKGKCKVIPLQARCGPQRVGRVIALLFHDRGTRRWVSGQQHAPAALYPTKDPIPIVKGTGWAPRPVWTGGKISSPTGIRSRTVQPVDQSLYRLSYRAHISDI